MACIKQPTAQRLSLSTRTGCIGGSTTTDSCCRWPARVLTTSSASDLADVLLERTASRIAVVHRNVDTDDATLEHPLIDQVLPRYLAHEGLLSLHASAADALMANAARSSSVKSGASSTWLGSSRAWPWLLSDDRTIVEVEAAAHGHSPTLNLRSLPDSVDALYPAGADLRADGALLPKQRVAAQHSRRWPAPTLAVDGLVVLR